MGEPWDSVPAGDALQLAPWAWVQLDNVQKANGFEYISGVRPDVVVALNDAREAMRGCIEPILGDVAAGRIRLDDPRLPTLTEDAYAEVVASRPQLARHIRCGRSGGRFTWDWALDADFRPTHQPDHVRFVNALNAQQRGGPLKALSPQAVGWLAGELCGAHTAGSLREAIRKRGDEAAVMERIVADLHAIGALLRAPANRLRMHWLTHVRDQDVVSLGHAALMARLGDELVLFDPWLVPWLSDAPTASLWTTLLPRPSALVFTHEHADHFDARALTSFPKDIPVLVPAPRRTAGLGYDYKAQLTALGFTRVVELEPGGVFPIGPAEIEAVPFYGEDPCDVELPRSCWMICDRGRNTLVWADSGPTNAGRSALSDGVVDTIRARRGPVNLLLSSQQQLQELRALSVYSAFCPPGTWFQNGENGFLTNAYLAELARRSGARQFVSYATGGADWLTDALPFVFGRQNPRRTAMITATWAPAADLAPMLAAHGCGWHPARACDIYRARRDGGTDILKEVSALSPEALFCVDHPRPGFLDKLRR